jgi:hypothetical protein
VHFLQRMHGFLARHLHAVDKAADK